MRNFRGKLLEKILRTPFKTFTEKRIGTIKRNCYQSGSFFCTAK